MKIIYDIAKEGGDEDLIYTEMVTIMEAVSVQILLRIFDSEIVRHFVFHVC